MTTHAPFARLRNYLEKRVHLSSTSRERTHPDDSNSERPDLWDATAMSRALFEQSPFSTIIYDRHGHPLAANPAFTKLWGVGLETAPPGYSVLTDPELERLGTLPIIRRAFEGEAVVTPPVPYQISRVSTTQAGHTVWTEGHFFPVRDANGTLTHVVLTHIDLTDREGEERFRRAFEASPDSFGIFRPVRDEAGRIVDLAWEYANGASLRMHGLSLNDLRGRGLLEQSPGAAVTGLFDAYRHTAETGETFESEMRYQHDGLDGWFRITAVQLGDGVAITFSDVTSRYRAEERARGLLNLASGLSEAATPEEVADVIFREGLAALHAEGGSLALVHDSPDGESLEVQMIRSRGYPEAIVTRYQQFAARQGRPLSDAIVTQRAVLLRDRSDWEERYPGQFDANVAPTGYEAYAALPVVVAGRTVAGISFSFHGRHHFDEDVRTQLETMARMCAQALERARAFESERREVVRRLQAQRTSEFLAEASRVLASSLDYEATLRNLANAAVPRLGDWCAVDMVVNPDSGAWPPTLRRIAVAHQDPARVEWANSIQEQLATDWTARAGIARVYRERVTEYIPVITDEMIVAGTRDPEHLRLIRQLHPTSLIVVPLIARERMLGAVTLLMTESGRHYTGADVAIAEDLARRASAAIDNAMLYAAAVDAQRGAERANRVKMEFLATMSHELRTPLNAISGYADLMLLQVRGEINEAQRMDLLRIKRSQEHLLSLINDVLNFAKVEAGKIEIDISRIPVGALIDALTPLIEPQIKLKGLTLEWPGCEPSVAALADEDKLRQILLNLLSNAVKYTAPGGRVTITADQTPTSVAIHVADTGAGIAADDLHRIFDPFVQLERKLTNVVEGAGLGLSISRDLARAMNGDLTASSERGVGSVFTVTLPKPAP